ncbi:MAG: hypothetical protein ACLQJR_13100 [Stellaceae bacterium]
MLDAGHLRETAGQLRNHAQSAAQGALREQLLALAEYYDDMAADIEHPLPLAPVAAAPPA